MKYFLFLILMFFVLGNSQAQKSLVQEISVPYLKKLIETAQQNYPKMKMYDSRLDIANYGIKKAKLSYFDLLSFSYLFSPGKTQTANVVNPAALTGYQFGLFLNIGSILQKPAMIKQARSELKVVEYDKESYNLNLAADVKQRYYTYIQHIMILRLKTESLLDTESLLKEVKYKYEKGESNLQNYTNALIAVASQQQNIISAETDVLISKSNLEELLGQTLEDIK